MFLGVGCDGSGVEEEEMAPSIVLGEAFNGISIGDDEGTVRSTLRVPDLTVEGNDGSSRHYFYSDGSVDTLQISLIEASDVGFSGVSSISVTQGYRGRTVEGIKIGSTQTVVRRVLGMPTDMLAEWDYYSYPERTVVSFEYQDDQVVRISMYDRIAVGL